jgi:hypothetical protein
MKFYQTLFSITPKALKAIDINLAGDKSLAMVDTKMTIPAKHQSIITSKPVSINYRAAADSFYGHIQQIPGRYIRDSFYTNYAISLVNTKYRHFSTCSTASPAFASAAEIGLIKLYFSAKKFLGIPPRRARIEYRIRSNALRAVG